VNEREGGTGHLGDAVEARNEAFHEFGFAGPKLTFKCQNLPGSKRSCELTPEPFGFGRTM
jgi:hypothetical protein